MRAMIDSNVKNISFFKMHGLGNDFVVIDSRRKNTNLTTNLIKKLGDRNFGVGFDQLAIIHDSEVSDARLTFFNSDGSKSATCGNATRCIANFLMDEIKKEAQIFNFIDKLLQETGKIGEYDQKI